MPFCINCRLYPLARLVKSKNAISYSPTDLRSSSFSCRRVHWFWQWGRSMTNTRVDDRSRIPAAIAIPFAQLVGRCYTGCCRNTSHTSYRSIFWGRLRIGRLCLSDCVQMTRYSLTRAGTFRIGANPRCRCRRSVRFNTATSTDTMPLIPSSSRLRRERQHVCRCHKLAGRL